MRVNTRSFVAAFERKHTCLHKLDTLKRALWQDTSVVLVAGAVGNHFAFNVGDHAVWLSSAPKTEILNVIDEDGAAKRIFASRCAFRADACSELDWFTSMTLTHELQRFWGSR